MSPNSEFGYGPIQTAAARRLDFYDTQAHEAEGRQDPQKRSETLQQITLSSSSSNQPSALQTVPSHIIGQQHADFIRTIDQAQNSMWAGKKIQPRGEPPARAPVTPVEETAGEQAQIGRERENNTGGKDEEMRERRDGIATNTERERDRATEAGASVVRTQTLVQPPEGKREAQQPPVVAALIMRRKRGRPRKEKEGAREKEGETVTVSTVSAETSANQCQTPPKRAGADTTSQVRDESTNQDRDTNQDRV